MASAPEPGDILVVKRRLSEAFALSTIPAPPQLVIGAYAAAVKVARAVAEHEGVNAWFEEDDGTFISLARYRSAEQGNSPDE